MTINLDTDLKFIFGINLQIAENNLVFDIHYNNILLSLAKLIVSMVTNNREKKMKELKEHVLDRKHHILDYSFIKIFQPKFQTGNSDRITFIRTYKPNHNINLKKLYSSLDKIKNKELKICFQKKKVLLSTRPPNLRKLLSTAKHETLLVPKQIKEDGFLSCANCIYHKNGNFKECLSFLFKFKIKLLTWYYKRFFSYDSKDVLYVIICNNFYFFINKPKN